MVVDPADDINVNNRIGLAIPNRPGYSMVTTERRNQQSMFRLRGNQETMIPFKKKTYSGEIKFTWERIT